MQRSRTRADGRLGRVGLRARSSVCGFLRKALWRRRVAGGEEQAREAGVVGAQVAQPAERSSRPPSVAVPCGKERVRRLEELVGEGDVEAMVKLGWLLSSGEDGVERDVERAVGLYECAIENGSVAGMVNLADLLQDGKHGVAADLQRAIALYGRAVDSGSAHAMCKLAEVLEGGKGGAAKDVKRATALDDGAVAEVGGEGAINMLAGVREDVRRAGALDADGSEMGGDSKSSAEGGSVGAIDILAGVREDVSGAAALDQSAIKAEDGRELGGDSKSSVEGGSEAAIDMFACVREDVPRAGALDQSAIKAADGTELGGDSKSRHCVMVVMGGAGRGKSSVARALRSTKRVRDAEMSSNEQSGSTGSVSVQVWELGGQGQCELAYAMLTGCASIVVLVVDVARLTSEQTRQDEIAQLCGCIHTAHAMCHDPALVEPVVVGTSKACYKSLDQAKQVLRDGLLHQLGDEAYNDWVRRKAGRAGNSMPFVAIEQMTLDKAAKASGLTQLDETVKRLVDRVVERREEIPARWTTLVNAVQRSAQLAVTSDDVNSLAATKAVGEHDTLCALRYHHKVGRVVLLEQANGDYCVFTHPAKLLAVVRAVTASRDVLMRRLGRAYAQLLERGLVRGKGLALLWKEYTAEEHELILRLLCEWNVLMRIKSGGENGADELFALAALLSTDLSGLTWRLQRGQMQLRLETKLDMPTPPGLAPALIAHLHRTLGEDKASFELLRANAVIVSVTSGQVGVVCSVERRSVTWVVRAYDEIAVAQRALRSLDGFLDRMLRRATSTRKHFIVSDCPRQLGGCGASASVRFELPERWPSKLLADVSNLEGECLDGQQWRFGDLAPRRPQSMRGEERFALSEPTVPYDVFIAHSTEDRYTLAYPLRDALTSFGWRVFVDGSEQHVRAAVGGSRMAMFVLSPSFVARRGPMLALRQFFDRLDEERVNEGGEVMLFGVFHKLSVEQCAKGVGGLSGVLERYGFFSEQNQRELSTDVASKLLKRLADMRGVERGREGEREFAMRAAGSLRDAFVTSYRQD